MGRALRASVRVYLPRPDLPMYYAKFTHYLNIITAFSAAHHS